MTVTSPVVLEPAAQQVADAFSKPPFLYEMAVVAESPERVGRVLNDWQAVAEVRAGERST